MSSKPRDRALIVPSGFRSDQFAIGLFAAGLDDQLALLLDSVREWEPRHFEWQAHPGHNTAGMLLAHIAVSECYWLQVAAQGLPVDAAADEIMVREIGIRMDNDGMPVAPAGGHPASLAAKQFPDYEQLLRRARAGTHRVLRGWRDAALHEPFAQQGRQLSRAWILYHVLEHLSGHFGQVLLLRHQLRDVGMLPPAAAE
ncbi:MAG: DinB family protein [Planctomycetota bacterium]